MNLRNKTGKITYSENNFRAGRKYMTALLAAESAPPPSLLSAAAAAFTVVAFTTYALTIFLHLVTLAHFGRPIKQGRLCSPPVARPMRARRRRPASAS